MTPPFVAVARDDGFDVVTNTDRIGIGAVAHVA
jgi:hypothetical protein